MDLGSYSHDDVWALLLPALKEARAAGHTYIESGRYVSRHSLPKFAVNEAGWPSVVARDRIMTTNSDPVDWKRMFTLSSDSNPTVPVSEVAALQTFIDTMTELAPTNPGIDRLINPRPGMHDADVLRFRWLEIGALLQVECILGRAEALGLVDDNDLHKLFSQLETAHLNESLPGDVVVPLLLTQIDSADVIELTDSLRIEPLSNDMQISRAVIHQGVSSENPYLVAAATHAVVMPSVDLPVGPYPGHLNLESVDLGPIHYVLDCLEVVADGATGFTQVIGRPIGWASTWTHALLPLQGIFVAGEYPSSFAQAAWNRAPKLHLHADQIGSVVSAHKVLLEAKPNVRIAARRSRRGGLRPDLEDELLDGAIGIEALLGNERDELTHRLALRASAVLADKFDPVQMYRIVKHIYAARSKLVHGAQLKNFDLVVDGNSYSLVATTRYLLGELLRNLLLDGEWTPEDIDLRILKSLRPPVAEGE